MPKSLIGTRLAAQRLGIGRRDVIRLVQRRELKPAAKVEAATGAYLFDPADVEALAASRATTKETPA